MEEFLLFCEASKLNQIANKQILQIDRSIFKLYTFFYQTYCLAIYSVWKTICTPIFLSPGNTNLSTNFLMMIEISHVKSHVLLDSAICTAFQQTIDGISFSCIM